MHSTLKRHPSGPSRQTSDLKLCARNAPRFIGVQLDAEESFVNVLEDNALKCVEDANQAVLSCQQSI